MLLLSKIVRLPSFLQTKRLKPYLLFLNVSLQLIIINSSVDTVMFQTFDNLHKSD